MSDSAIRLTSFRKDSSDSTALLQKKDKSGSPPPTIVTTGRKGIAWVGLVPTAFVIAVSFGLGSTLLLWLITHQAPMFQKGIGDAVRNGTFIVDEGGSKSSSDGDSTSLLRALTFSALASHLISLTSSFLMTLVAYRTAAQWLRNSEPGHERLLDKNPTPLQYGLVSDLLATSSIMGIFRSLKYTFRKRNNRASLPRILIEALVIAIVVLVLNHAVGLADFWLHSTSRSILVPLQTPLPSDPSADHGVAFNQTFCDEWYAMSGNSDYPCFHTASGWASTFQSPTQIGWALSYNISLPGTSLRVVTLNAHNDTAILVPLSTIALSSSPGLSSNAYTFTSTGAQASCKVITNQCAQDQLGHVTDCTQAGSPWLPMRANGTGSTCAIDDPGCLNNRIFGVINGGTGSFQNGIMQVFPANASTPTNPAPMMVQLKFFNSQVNTLVRPASGSVDGNQALYASCDLAYLNVTAHYDPTTDSFDLTNSEVATPALAAILWGPLLAQYASDRLAADMQGSALIEDIDTVTALLNQDLGRIAIGWVGGIHESVAATQSWTVSYTVLGQYPVAPVFSVVAILYAYTVFAIFIFFSSVNAASYSIDAAALPKNKDEPAVEKRALVLGQTWLTNSLPFIGYVFHHEEDVRRSVAENSLEMVHDDDGERLALGVHDTGHGAAFGLRRRCTAPASIGMDA